MKAPLVIGLSRGTRGLVLALLCVASGALVEGGPGPASAQAASAQPGGGQLAVGTFLVARNNLPDPNFFEAVILLLSYDEQKGAAGLVVNRRTDVSVADAVAGRGPFSARRDILFLGGPVAVRSILVLHRGGEPPEGATHIVDDVHLVGERESLEGFLRSEPAATTVRFYAGYAGWSPGQLEDEIERGVWHVMAGDAARVFSESPGDDWADLIRIVFGPRA